MKECDNDVRLVHERGGNDLNEYQALLKRFRSDKFKMAVARQMQDAYNRRDKANDGDGYYSTHDISCTRPLRSR